MSKLLTTLALALAFAALSAGAHAAKLLGKSDHDSYVVIMHPEPVIAYEGDIRGYPATRPGQGHKINPNSAHVRKYQRFLEKGHRGAMQRAGVPRKRRTHDYTMALNGFAVRMSHEEAGRLAMQKDVALVIPDELQQPMTENSPEYLELTAPGGPYLKGYDGENVVVGVIDTGIWPEHPSFADDGSYTPLDTDVPCEFGNTAHHPDDQPFDCNGKLLGARDMATTYRALIGADPDEFWSARDDSGHGTHTASTAAGNAGVQATIFDRDFGDVAGIAPRARIIAYKGLGKLGGFGSDLAAAIDQAVADGVDVINYSIGSSSFAIGADDVAFLFAADAGVHVATSNGNSGPEAATIGSPASIPWVTSVGASTQNRTFQGSVTTGAGAEYFGASITGGSDELPLVDAAAAGDALCNPGALDPAMVAGNIVLCLRGEIARVAKSEAVAEAGGAGMILYNADDADTRNTDLHLVPSVHVNNTDGLAIKTYIAATAEPTARIAGGAFSPIEAPWMAAFSSRGPNLLTGDIIKPDVTAPGVNILAGNTPISYDPGAPGQ
ncbi:MAG: S8 family serine peptidase, partial [Pseudomonadota bacterium]